MISKKKIILVFSLCCFVGVISPTALFSGFIINFTGPLRGKIVDADTRRPISNCELRLTIDACLGSQLFNPGGCNPTGIYEKSVFTNSNGEYEFPFHIIYKNPIGQINRIRLTVNNLHGTELVYDREYHSTDVPNNKGISISGRKSGYEQLDIDVDALAWHRMDFSLINLKTEMHESACPANMEERDRRRCLYHVAIRESMPLIALARAHGIIYRRPTEKLYLYYCAKDFGDRCDNPRNVATGIESEIGCRDVLKVLDGKYSLCAFISECKETSAFPGIPSIPSQDISDLLEKECQKHHIGSMSHGKEGTFEYQESFTKGAQQGAPPDAGTSGPRR